MGTLLHYNRCGALKKTAVVLVVLHISQALLQTCSPHIFGRTGRLVHDYVTPSTVPSQKGCRQDDAGVAKGATSFLLFSVHEGRN